MLFYHLKNKIQFFLILMFFAIISCGGGGGALSKENILITDGNKRLWTFVIYMAADNDLESEAMRNLNQLEAVSGLNTNKISILVLIDRNPGHDSTDGNWTDTRLFEVLPDSNGINTKIVSKRLECPPLELTEDGEKELDMSDYHVLSGLLSFAKNKYQAENYALIMWGHGTGWRNAAPSRGFAIDDTTGFSAAMSTPHMRKAVSGKNLALIGFDTCFSALLEVSYELKDCTPLIIGTPGLAPSSGWDYYSLFSDFIVSDMKASSFEDCLINSYRSIYANSSGTAVAIIDTSKITNVFNCLESLSETLASCITTTQLRNDAVVFCTNASIGYGSTSFPSDWFLNIYDFSESVKNNPEIFSTDNTVQTLIQDKADDLKNSVAVAVKKSWSKDNIAKPFGVHFIPFVSHATPASRHSDAYMKGTSVLDKPMFVTDSVWWTPSTPKAQSFLDKLFYTTF